MESTKRWIRLATACFIVFGCARGEQEESLTIATTTSTHDSGLLDVLVPMFETETRIGVRVVAVGSGQALELGRRGDADVLLTHAPVAEEQFMADGFGAQRHQIMYNDFVLLGPATDPATIQGEPSILNAFRRVAQSESYFVSRGDDSGTHMKERAIWEQAGLRPEGDWYVQAGAGMVHVLRIANERRAYTLSDRATFLAHREQHDLVIVSEGDFRLRNTYSVIVVSSRKHPHIHKDAAERFVAFLLDPTTQAEIRQFGVHEFGQPLFMVDNASTPGD